MRSGDRYFGKRSHETMLSFAAKTKPSGETVRQMGLLVDNNRMMVEKTTQSSEPKNEESKASLTIVYRNLSPELPN